MSCGNGPRSFTKPDSALMAKSIAKKLVPVVDKIRDLRTRLGFRPYLVRLIRVSWHGGARGRGAETILHTLDILPVPKVLNLSTMTEVTTPIGLIEAGGLLITEISGDYSEEILLGQDATGVPVGPAEEVFYEVEFVRADKQTGTKRRFNVSGAPAYEPERFQWSVSLTRAHEARSSSGDLR